MTGPADGSLIGPAGGSLPGVRELRRRLRRLRRRHRTGRTADLLTDGYLVVLLIGMYAGIAWPVLHRQLVSPAPDGPAAAGAYRAWLVAAVVVVFTGGAWHGLRALGPLLVRPPVLSWCLTSPVRRAGWLRPWLLGLLAVGAVGGALTMIGAAGATLTARPWAYAVPGAAAGLTLTAAAVAAQARPATRHASGAAVGRRVGRVRSSPRWGSVSPPWWWPPMRPAYRWRRRACRGWRWRCRRFCWRSDRLWRPCAACPGWTGWRSAAVSGSPKR